MIRSLGRLCAVFAVIVVVNTPDSVRAGSVAVGSSSLIGNLDYSDTFTLTANGGEAGRTANTFPVPSSGLNIENTYGNPTQSWGSSLWSISSDSAANSGALAYPGGSGGGSATGITQAVSATNADVIYGLNYGLHNNYVVQTDIVQTADRVGFTSGTSPNNITSGLAVFFRADSVAGHPYGGVGLFNGSLETAVYNTASGNYTSGAALLLTGTSVGQCRAIERQTSEKPARSFSNADSSQPQTLRLPRMLPFIEVSCCKIVSASLRKTEVISGPFPLRIRLESSVKVTSRI